MRCTTVLALAATLLATQVNGQPVDCASIRDALGKTIRESPELRALKQHYELMVVQMYRAHPGAQAQIEVLARSKADELQSKCKSKSFASQWYSDQIGLLHAGKWNSVPGSSASK